MERLASSSAPVRYAVSFGASVLALVVTLALMPLFERAPFLLFFLAIILSAWFGGLGPGLMSTALAILFSDLFLIGPFFTSSVFDTAELLRLCIFGAVGVVISLLYDARQRSERQLADRLNILSHLYTMTETVSRTTVIDEIYARALEALASAVKADRAAILLFDANGVMQFKASRGLSDEYRIAAAGHSPWSADARNPVPLAVPNVETESSLEKLRPVILGEGIRALAFIPLVSGDRLVGKFMVYYNSPHVFTPDELQIAQTIGRQVVLALERLKADNALKQSQKQLEVILEGITDGITVQDRSGALIYANQAAAHTLGFDSPEALLATPLSEVMRKFEVLDEAGTPFPLTRLPGRLALQGQQPQEELVQFRVLETGQIHWSVVNAAPVFDSEGKVILAVNMFRDFTARRQAEEAERMQRELLQVTLRSIGDAVIATDTRTQVTFMNPIAETLTGWSQADALGQPLADVFKIISEDTRQTLASPAARVLTEGIIVGLANHTLLITREGRELPIDDSGAPIRDANGEVVGVVLVFRDVTEQRRAQIGLGRLAAIVEFSEDAILSKTLDAIVTSWNRGAERLYGYTADEMIGHSVAILIPASHPTELQENMARLKNGMDIPPYETLRQHKGGRLIDVLVTISPIKDGEGNIVGASTIARDITDRKRAEAERARLYVAERAAREQAERVQERLTILAEASHILASSLDYETTLANVARLVVPQLADWCSVHIVQEDGSIKQLAVAHVDPAKVEKIHELQRRYPPDPAAERGVAHVIKTGQPELTPEISDELLARLISDPELLEIIRKLGFRSAMTLPLIARDCVLGAIAFATAESGRVYGADDLALAQDLARRAAAAIDNAQLYRQAEAAVQVRDQFLSLASHELKTPITSIMGFAELLQHRTAQSATLTERDRRALALVYVQSTRLAQLINSLLDLSRIESGQFSIERAPVDLDALVTRTIEALQLNLERHTITYKGPSEPLIIQGDDLRLEQVFQNLIQNAIKYSPHGGSVQVTLERTREGALFSISDHGIGIPQDMIPLLFNRFYRTDNVAEYRISGMGIGLYVVKQIVSLHGGHIQVTSQEGQGSTFQVTFPLGDETKVAEHYNLQPAD